MTETVRSKGVVRAVRAVVGADDINLDDLGLGRSLTGWDVALAALTLIITWIAGRLARRAVLGLLSRTATGVSEDLRRLAGRVAKYLVWLVGLGIALSFLGAEVQPLLAAVLIVAVIAALSLRATAENFGAGLVIQSRKAIQLGDHIESSGLSGTVTGINGRAVVMQTLDGRTVHIPNASVLRNPIVNDSVQGRRRSDLEVRAAISVDGIDDLHGTVASAIAETSAIDHSVTPMVATVAVEPERVTLLVRVWHEPGAGVSARSATIHAMARALRDQGIDATIIAPPPAAPLTPPASP